MIIIYSNDVVDNLVGTYINPTYFEGIERGAKLVYTDDAKIKDAYKDTDVEVKPLTEKTEDTSEITENIEANSETTEKPKTTSKAKEDK